MICIYSDRGQRNQKGSTFSGAFRAESSGVNQGEEWKNGAALCLMGTWTPRPLEIPWVLVERITVGQDRLRTFESEACREAEKVLEEDKIWYETLSGN